MVRIGIVYLLGVLMEYLKLDEVDSLLKEIDIPKVLQMENEFRLGSETHLNFHKYLFYELFIISQYF